MRSKTVLIAAFCLLVNPAAADDRSTAKALAVFAMKVLACKATADDKDRLKCFDKEVEWSPTPSKEDIDAVASGADTKELTRQAKPGEYRLADPADMAVAPTKFIGKPIEVRNFHCYYADQSDYRCGAPGAASVTIFAKSIVPTDDKERFENACGSIKKVLGAGCRKTIRFTPANFDEDLLDYGRKRNVFHADVIEFVRPK